MARPRRVPVRRVHPRLSGRHRGSIAPRHRDHQARAADRRARRWPS
jgi:hypothetical protein